MRQKTSVSPFPLVIAHRGASAERPENTIAAFDEALRQGADGIELDVQCARDGIPVVYHDRSLRKAGAGLRRVASLDTRDLDRLDAGGWFGAAFRNERIPHLAHVLDRYTSTTRLLTEIKLRGTREDRARLARAVAEMIRARRIEHRTYVLCFDDALLREARRAAPALRSVLNLDPPARMTATVRARLPGLAALSVDIRGLTPAFAAAVRDAGLALFTYTCNTERAVLRSLAAGASAVMTDRPRWLRETIVRLRAGG